VGRFAVAASRAACEGARNSQAKAKNWSKWAEGAWGDTVSGKERDCDLTCNRFVQK